MLYFDSTKSKFTDGQPHAIFALPPNDDGVIPVTVRVRNADDLFYLGMLADVANHNRIKVGLTISYLMGGRMDRRIDDNQPFTLRMVCEYINSLKFEWVNVIEPH